MLPLKANHPVKKQLTVLITSVCNENIMTAPFPVFAEVETYVLEESRVLREFDMMKDTLS